jgi:hypothetical protein
VSGGHATHSDKLTAFATTIIAVLAALATLFAHGRSIHALAFRNQAVLLTAKASDLYDYYQTKQLKVTLYTALNDRAQMRDEQRSSLAIYSQAKELEQQAADENARSDKLLGSFETLEIATTLFEIAIAFASISALTETRYMLWSGIILSAIGIVVGLIGYFAPH